MVWFMLLQVFAVILILAAFLAWRKSRAKLKDSAGAAVNPKKQFYMTLVSSILLSFLLAQPHAGFMIYIFAFPLLIWFTYSIYVAIAKPDLRKWQLIRMSVWIVSVLVILGIHYNRRETARHYADNVVAAIKEYKSEHGNYPDNIEMIGISRQQLKNKLGLSGYSFEKNTPSLFYADTFIVYQTHDYDFQKNIWVYHAD